MVDEALEESREGNIVSRVARDITGGEENAQVPPRVTYSRAAVEQLVERVVTSVNRPAQDAEVEFPSLERSRSSRLQGDAAALEQRIEQALTVPGVDRRVEAPVSGSSRRSPATQLAQEVPGHARGRPQQLQAAALQEPEALEDLHRGGGRAGVRHPGRAVPHPEQGGGPRLARAATATGPATWPARWSRAACPRTRSRRAGWASTTAPASTAPTRPTRSGSAASHGCIRMAVPGRDRAVRPGSGRRADLHRLSAVHADLGRSGSPPSPALPRGSGARCVECRACRCISRAQASAAPRTTWWRRRSVPGSACQGATGRWLVRQSGIGELIPCGHPSVLRVDEEHSHFRRG